MRRAIVSVVVAIALTVTGFLLGPATASAQQDVGPGSLVVTPNIPASGTFNIHNYGASGKCIGISGNNAGDWNCTSNPDQTWHWGGAIATGWYQLVNGNGKCLGISGGSDAVGAQVVAWGCNGNADQYWALGSSSYPGANTVLNYKAWFDPNTAAALIGVGGGSTANGAPVVLWSSDGSPNQSWH